MKRIFIQLFIMFVTTPGLVLAQSIPFTKGRIAISSDGNEHDKDDWAATPFSLALLAAKGYQDKLTLYTFSDHVWGSNHDHKDAAEQMRISALEGQQQFGFENTEFIEAVATPNAAYAAMTAEINKSTANDPLTIIAAGPMQVVGKALNDANQNKLQYVRIISHSKWNDRHSDNPNDWENHSGWTWAEIENKFKPKGLIVDHITDQNGGTGYDGLRADKSKFAWLKNSPAKDKAPYKVGSWDWLYSRQEAAQKGQEFDPSDAGMIVYLLTGKEKTDPSDARAIMENPEVGDGDQDQNNGSCDTKYAEDGGLVIMEAENAENMNSQLGNGKWIKKTDVGGYTGTGHLEFTGNNQSSGPPKNPLKYTFTIQKSGFYRLIIRSHKRLDGAESDKSNDCYVRVEGDYGPGPNPGNNHNDDAQLSTLKKDTKFFGGSANGWGWAQMLDLGGHDNKRTAIYNFKAGESYTMWVSGRSKNYNFDRIVFYHQNDYTLNTAKNTQGVSETLCDGEIVTNQAPVLSIPNLTNGQLFQEGEEILIQANASDTDGSIAKVEFFNGSALLKSDNSSPYSYLWPDAPIGTHTIRVVAHDDDGATTTKTRGITVNAEGQLVLSPIHDAYVQGANGFNNADIRVEPGNRIGYLKFDLSGSSTGEIIDAVLKLTVGSDAGNGTIQVFKGTSNNWTEQTINASTAPSEGDLLASKTGTLAVGQTYNFVLPAEELTGTSLTLVVKMTNGGNDVSFASKENTQYAAPELAIVVDETVTSFEDASMRSSSVYPNPVTDVIHFEGKLSEGWKIRTIQGALILTGTAEKVSLNALPSGMYLVEFAGEQRRIIKK